MRGAGCIMDIKLTLKVLSFVAVPVRGAGCIYRSLVLYYGKP